MRLPILAVADALVMADALVNSTRRWDVPTYWKRRDSPRAALTARITWLTPNRSCTTAWWIRQSSMEDVHAMKGWVWPEALSSSPTA